MLTRIVDRAVLAGDRRDAFPNRVPVGDIENGGGGLAALVADLCHRRVERLRISPVEDDVRAGAGEALGDCQAKPACRAGHEGRSAGKVEGKRHVR